MLDCYIGWGSRQRRWSGRSCAVCGFRMAALSLRDSKARL